MTADLLMVDGLCRLVHDAAAIVLWGGFGYLSLVSGDLGEAIARRLEPLRVAAILAAVVTAWLRLPLEAAMVGNGWADGANPAILVPLLTQTDLGIGWLIEAAVALILLATLPLRPPGRAWAASLLAGALLATLPLGGHAMMRSGFEGILAQANDAVHVLAGGAWLGALLPLILVLRQVERGAEEAALAALRRFSRIAPVAVALTLATGAINTILIVGGAPLDWAAPYQALLSAKVAMVLVMIGLASRNRYVYTPIVGVAPARAARAIRIGTIGEVAVGAVVLGLVAWFGLMDPMMAGSS